PEPTEPPQAAVAAALAAPASPAAPTQPAPTPTAPTQPAPTQPAAVPAGGGSGQARPAVPVPSAGTVALAKPPVRKLAKDLGVDLHQLVGSGPQGSITRDDVQAAVAAPATPAAGRERRIPIKGVRKHTAANMVASAFTAPHATVFLTVDVTRAMRAVERLKTLPEWRDVRVSPLLLVAKAALVGIAKHPMINSTWSGETGEIIVKEYVNLGIAAATERGLIVPNIKDAGRLSLRELAEAMNALVGVAREGRTAPAELTGGTFSITNVGVFGVDGGTPILPPGEAAILAFGVVRETPWVHKGKIKIRQVTTLSLSFDHRIVDGELGSKFLRDVGRFLHDPLTAVLGSV
ncbi:dihydrolipoamide acetyltransferase family protein, partial [Luedemannella helvata]|uniref:dihydrolipoamide acetyltransferase family protein n=1 Tax=Luedemannella helvata TaxID=349315 RepID=UPI0031D31044